VFSVFLLGGRLDGLVVFLFTLFGGFGFICSSALSASTAKTAAAAANAEKKAKAKADAAVT
jgi:hypothetical protein